MSTALVDALPGRPGRPGLQAPLLNRHEWLIVVFFVVLAIVGFKRSIAAWRVLLLAGVPFLLWGLCRLETMAAIRWSPILREWLSMGMILPAYWSLQLLVAKPLETWQQEFLAWDRWILYSAGLRAAIEVAGFLIPAILETAYMLLYTIPPAALALIYLRGPRRHTKQFLQVLLLGTLAAYVLIPLFPVISPRYAFPEADLPSYESLARSLNVWVLDHLDISTGVFPSGHVAVAFSTAFGLMLAAPKLRAAWILAFVVAGVIFVATIYGRYHYAADGLASIAIAAVAWQSVGWWEQDAE
jgi:membrane-associated phospholipid phosphatase